MRDVRDLLSNIARLPLHRPARVLCLSGDQERVIAASDMRRLLPDQVELMPGPGCAASACPEHDVLQAMRLAERHELTLLVDENLLRLPLNWPRSGCTSLADAQRSGADVRPVAAPIEALLAARAQPGRQTVLFVAGFETLLVPLAGMILEGLPANLSLLLCGRRVEPLIDRLLADDVDGLVLPGNRCALTGTADWDRLAAKHRKPAVVAGYSAANILAALHAVLVQHARGAARVDNHYRVLARRHGNELAQDRLERVFESDDGHWRGVGMVEGTGLRLRHSYRDLDANHRFPNYRDELPADDHRMPAGCQCAAVMAGRRLPVECPLYSTSCTPQRPHGPCMASTDGTCFLHRKLALREVA